MDGVYSRRVAKEASLPPLDARLSTPLRRVSEDVFICPPARQVMWIPFKVGRQHVPTSQVANFGVARGACAGFSAFPPLGAAPTTDLMSKLAFAEAKVRHLEQQLEENDQRWKQRLEESKLMADAEHERMEVQCRRLDLELDKSKDRAGARPARSQKLPLSARKQRWGDVEAHLSKEAGARCAVRRTSGFTFVEPPNLASCGLQTSEEGTGVSQRDLSRRAMPMGPVFVQTPTRRPRFATIVGLERTFSGVFSKQPIFGQISKHVWARSHDHPGESVLLFLFCRMSTKGSPMAPPRRCRSFGSPLESLGSGSDFWTVFRFSGPSNGAGVEFGVASRSELGQISVWLEKSARSANIGGRHATRVPSRSGTSDSWSLQIGAPCASILTPAPPPRASRRSPCRPDLGASMLGAHVWGIIENLGAVAPIGETSSVFGQT